MVSSFSGQSAFDKIVGYIEKAKQAGAEVLAGGKCKNSCFQATVFDEWLYHGLGDKSKGYYIHPTILLSKDPKSITFVEEIFGPVLSVSGFIIILGWSV